MTRSRNWIFLLCLLMMSAFVTLGGISSVVYANVKNAAIDTSTPWVADYRVSAVKSAGSASTNDQLSITALRIEESSRTPATTTYYLKAPNGISASTKAHSRPIVQRVRPGDTLWALAAQNGTSVQALMQMNHLNTAVIHPGQKLIVYKPGWKIKHVVVHASRRAISPHVNLTSVSSKGIPVQLIPVYMAAGQKYGIPWTVLAAIHRTETDFSTGAVVSWAGAEGPMQFMPSTFQRYGVTAPGCQGAPDINNVYDAIYTAAHMLALDGYSSNPVGALYQYNHSMTYVESIQSLAQAYQV
ncbi:LysM peptidoglycan-binding domain-containing protein [Alicyclobacillus ferrooxydans]|uniref:LysM peptidoglycan-binding domain-containing protein n=1 Tax=Alicyclobacillus ferrooxydans TaxID=471514 RepID=UPI0006D56F5C|nr:LysM peptidoglycan-binding domain-containing protein [Alicyclobacillus ferrooxydans]